ncbi:hypothetical protein V5799_009703 [Amblyomma americanum]|uniref:Monocarboxylate transporter n=1 Tax=Amblyomma americanum TaxID=6943 RepID=A0AAQ4FB03_AMBAM
MRSLLTSVLQQSIPVYHITLLGILLVCGSLVASSFSPNIVWMSVLVGGTYGAGAGIVMITLSFYTLTYFDKYRATATAFKYVGWAASGVVGPSLFAYASENYGSLPALLLVGAIAAHAIPLVMLLKSPRPVTFRFPWSRESSSATGDKFKSLSVRNCCNAVGPPNCSLSDEAAGGKYGKHNRGPVHKIRISHHTTRCTLKGESLKIEDLNSPHSEGMQVHMLGVSEKCTKNNLYSGCTNSEQFGADCRRTQYLVVKAPDMLKHCTTLFRSVYLYALVACYVAIDYSSSMHEGTIVAYAVDKKAGTLNQCNQLQTFAAVGQLVGRVVVPFVSDKIPFSRCPLAAGSLALSAGSLVLMSFVSDYVVLSVLTTGLGVCRGFLLCVKGVLYGDYLGVESLSFACGVQGVSLVPALITAPAAIGYFRDTLGSYDQFYWMLAALNLVAASVVCCIALTDFKRRKTCALN